MDKNNFDFEAKANEVAEEYNLGGGDLFDIQEGDNIVRVLSGYTVIARHFAGIGMYSPVCFGKDKGCPYHETVSAESDELKMPLRIRCIFWLLDRRDNKIKLAFMPYKFASLLGKIQKEAGGEALAIPMECDVNFKALGAGDKEVVYTLERVDGNPFLFNDYGDGELTSEQCAELENKKTTEDVAESMKGRAMSDAGLMQ